MSIRIDESKFEIPGDVKTLKLRVKHYVTLAEAVNSAYAMLWQNTMPGYLDGTDPQREINRIEFKYNKTYVVIAKLKEEK